MPKRVLQTPGSGADRGCAAKPAGRAKAVQTLAQIGRWPGNCRFEFRDKCIQLPGEHGAQSTQCVAVAADRGQSGGIVEQLRGRARLGACDSIDRQDRVGEEASEQVVNSGEAGRFQKGRGESRYAQLGNQSSIEFGTRCDRRRVDSLCARSAQQGHAVDAGHASIDQQQVWNLCVQCLQRGVRVSDGQHRTAATFDCRAKKAAADRIVVGNQDEWLGCYHSRFPCCDTPETCTA